MAVTAAGNQHCLEIVRKPLKAVLAIRGLAGQTKARKIP
jgi:hypothetical protein